MARKPVVEEASESEEASSAEGDELELALDEHGRIQCEANAGLNTGFRSFREALAVPPETLAALTADMANVFTEETFFLGADEAPRCTLERLARDVFRFHTAAVRGQFSESSSGAEWWVQVRQPTNAACDESIGLHWDKDEDLVDSQGLNVHPQISTITYLSDWGTPTLILEKTASVQYFDDAAVHGPIRQGFLSHPAVGKHVSFDGRFLHGAPSKLRTAVARPDADPQPSSRSSAKKRKKGGAAVDATLPHKRFTFLVNIWLGYRPVEATRFPVDALGRLACNTAVKMRLAASKEAPPRPVKVTEGAAPAAQGDPSAATCEFRFPFGPSGAEHYAYVPLPQAILHPEGGAAASHSSYALAFSKKAGCRVGPPPQPKFKPEKAKKGKKKQRE